MDRTSLMHVLIGVSNICHEKAALIRAKWNESDRTCRNHHAWDEAGEKIDRLVRSLPNVEGINE